ncbi:MAG: lysophospholipid acyltransferase family protein [Hyphomicrobiaceae bacterium]
MSIEAPRNWIDEGQSAGLGSRILAGAVLAGFMGLTLPLMPVQLLLLKISRRGARGFPHWYHRQVCRLLGIRVRVEGELAHGAPVLLVANHTSWLDIPVISAAAPVSFVAKREVAGWPFVSWLAKLQRTVFVDRTRRTSIGDTANEMIARLNTGDTLVLFAEGTSSDGNRVLPFKTSLLAAAKPTHAISNGSSPAVVQTLAIVYTHLHGLPLGRADRPFVGWYGDMEMGSHAWELLKAGPLDVTVRLGKPVPLDSFADRKALARHSEEEVKAGVVELLRGRRPAGPAHDPDPDEDVGDATT